MASKVKLVVIVLAYLGIMIGLYVRLEEGYSKCINEPENQRPAVLNRGSWKTVSKKNDIYVYSAFHDSSDPNLVRVISILPRNRSINVWCVLKRGDVEYRVKASIEHHPESHGRRLTTGFIYCHIEEIHVPDSVVILETSAFNSSSLKVHRLSNEIYTHNFTLCLSPLHSLYNNTTQLVHWIEMNMILGVTFFTCYIHSASEDVLMILKHYQSIGKVQLLPWKIEDDGNDVVQNTSDLHYHGQTAAINDCLYRNKGISKYVAIYDLDEIITPRYRNDKNWYDMLQRMPDASAYLFRHTMFHHHHVTNVRHHDDFFTRTNRSTVVLIPDDRSKVIVKTNDVISLRIHNVLHMKSRKTRHIVVAPEIGLLHHYRLVVHKYMVTGHLVDNSILKFKRDLAKRVTSTNRKLQRIDYN